jgi:hypothetical protein
MVRSVQEPFRVMLPVIWNKDINIRIRREESYFHLVPAACQLSSQLQWASTDI